MILFSRARTLAVGAIVVALFSVSPGFAQEISESHMKAARAAVAAIGATDEFDSILPAAARALKDQLTQQSPDLYDVIDQTVNEKALALTARYADLEKEAATAYAKVFSEADLNAIAAFYTSEPGKKLLQDGPIVTRELLQAADIWQRGIARDLAVQSAEVLAAKGAPTQTDPASGTAPVAPAPEQAPAPAQN